ncbi:MAG: PEP-CTERM sorting domain-containing protein [Sedimentisphaerales bacterium]|nr:PEP-CTERM sorting domain-containing protein [Sedimentisphaerales bacterium]
MKKQKRILAVVTIMMIITTIVLADETGMGPNPIYTATLKGDFVVAGASTRIYSGAPQTEPFSVNISGVPNGSQIVKAYANWSYLTDSPNGGGEASITINGSPVTGNLTGQGDDLCWGRDYAAAYTADVTSLILGGGNGVYTIGSATDDASSGGIGEGFSLLLVYGNEASILKEINVYSGYTHKASSSETATATYDFLNSYNGGPAHFFINALDGQNAGDDFYINGILASGLIPGTGGPGDAWLGDLGPGASGTNYYDHAEGDASGFMIIGDMSLLAVTTGGSDCIGHTFGAIAFTPEPATMVLLSLGGMAVIRRRKK